jgi:hypothetical protein
MRWTLIPSALVVTAVLVAPAASAPADNSGKRFHLSLEGEQEAPVVGDPDGTGTATFRLNLGLERFCYTLTVSGIAPATAAHVHEGPFGDDGPPVIHLTAPTNGTSSGCVSADRELLQDIILHPENYYVNVHNTPFPGGALRSQLDL